MSYYDDEIQILDEENQSSSPRPSSPRNNGKNGRSPKKKAANKKPPPKKAKRYVSKQNGPTQKGKGGKSTENGHLNNRRGNSRKAKVLGHKGSLRGIPASSVNKGSVGSRSKRINAQIRAQYGSQVKNNLQTNDNHQGSNNDNRPAKAKNGHLQQQLKKRNNHKGKNNKKNRGKKKGKARSKENLRYAKSVSSIGLIEKGKGGKHHHRSNRKLHGSKESVFLCPCGGRVPWWCFLLITTMVVVLAALAIGVVFLVNSERKQEVDLLFGSRCRDTFILYPDQYHQESTRIESINTLEGCRDRCLELPRARCAAINYNKEGGQGNRCYILEYEALSYKHGYYTGVDEYLRQMCDSVNAVSGSGGNGSSGSLSASSTYPPGFSTTAGFVSNTARASVCQATYTLSADRFGVGGDYLEPAKTVEECLDACSSIPYCPAVEFDRNVGTCYIHHSPFDGRLFTAARVDHYDRDACPSTAPITAGPNNVQTTRLVTVLMRTTEVKPTRMTSRRMTTLPGRKTTLRQTARTPPPVVRRTTQDVTSSTSTTASTTTTTTTTTTTPTTTSTTTTASTTKSTTQSTSTSTTPTSTSSTTTRAAGPPISTPTLPPLDENCQEDLTIIIDMSGPSDGPNSKNFVNTINLAQNVVNNIRVGPRAMRVSVIIFSTLAFTSFHLNANHSKADVLHLLGELQFIGGLANLPRAMKLWFTDHKPQSDLLGRKGNVLLLSDVYVSTMYDSQFIHEAGQWRTLTFQGDLVSIVVSSPNAHTANIDKFTPLHTFTVIDYYDLSQIISGVIDLLPCRDPRPMPFDRPGDSAPAPPPEPGTNS